MLSVMWRVGIAALVVGCHGASGAHPDADAADATDAPPIDAPIDAAIDGHPGCAWEVETVGTSNDPSRPVIAVATDGGVHILFYDPTDCHSLEYAYKAPGATSWSLSPLDDHVGSAAQYFSLAVDAAGALHTSFYQDAGPLGCPATSPQVMYGYKPAGGAWGTFPVATPIGGNGGEESAIAVDGGEADIAYDGNPNSMPSLQFAHGSLSSWSVMTVPTTIPNDPIGEFPSMRIDPAHVVHISTLRSGSNAGLVYAERSATGSWTTTTIETGPWIGLTSAIEVDAAAGVHIAYEDFANSQLHYAYRPAGGAWSTTPIDTNYALVHETIRVDSTGTLHIIYSGGSPFNGVPSQVRHAHAAIGGAWTIEPVGPDTGVFGPSLALGPSDTLHVVYARMNGAGWDVRYAHLVCN